MVSSASLLFSGLSYWGDFHGGDRFFERAAQLKEARRGGGFHAPPFRRRGRERQLEVLRKIDGALQTRFDVRTFQSEGIEMQGAVRDGKFAFAGRPARGARVESAGVHAGEDIPASKLEVLELQFSAGGKLRDEGLAADAGSGQVQFSSGSAAPVFGPMRGPGKFGKIGAFDFRENFISGRDRELCADAAARYAASPFCFGVTDFQV